MTRSIYAIVPAAGSSRRMNSATPKLLMKLGGEAVIVRTLKNLLSIPDLKRIIVPTSRENEIVFQDLLHALSPIIKVIIGGATRTESVRKGIDAIEGEAMPDDLVIVHDGARCFADKELFLRVLSAAAETGAATAAIPVVDTVKIVKDGVVTGELDRNSLWNIQTPQIFQYNVLFKAHQGDVQATDDASLVERIQPVSVIEGNRLNFKLTTQDDFKLAEALVS